MMCAHDAILRNKTGVYMPASVMIFVIDSHQVMATNESLALPSDDAQIGAMFDSHGNLKPILRKSAFGQILLGMHSGQRQAVDRRGNALLPGMKVTCVDNSLGGDTGSESTEWLAPGGTYEVESIHDEPHLVHPMITLRGFDNGPVFPERFEKN